MSFFRMQFLWGACRGRACRTISGVGITLFYQGQWGGVTIFAGHIRTERCFTLRCHSIHWLLRYFDTVPLTTD